MRQFSVLVFAGIAFAMGQASAGDEAPKKEDSAAITSQLPARLVRRSFPRTDGVYCVAKTVFRFGRESPRIYDYFVFRENGVVYKVKGGYTPLRDGKGEYHLERPYKKFAGQFIPVPLKIHEQPAFILKWISDKKMETPFNAKYQVNGQVVSFTITRVGFNNSKITESYVGYGNGNRLTLRKNEQWQFKKLAPEKLVGEFVPFPR